MAHASIQLRSTVLAIAASVIALALLAVWDEQQEGRMALEDFAADQAVVARSLALQLETRLDQARKDAQRFAADTVARQKTPASQLTGYLGARRRPREEAPLDVDPAVAAVRLTVGMADGFVVDLLMPLSELTGELAAFERPASEVVLILPPGQLLLRTVDGRQVAVPPIATAVESGAKSVHLSRADAATLGLPERLAVAGLAAVDVADLGRWSLAYVTSAKRVRDREQRARLRLILGVLTAGGLVMGFGALALRRQRRELELSHELAVAAVERDHERRLENANRAATLGTLAMGIAHEIATPASVIQGRAEQLLHRAGNDERSSGALQAIVEQAHGITEVVRGFLDLARGDSPPTGVVHLSTLIDGACELVEHRFTKARVSLSAATLPPELPTVVGDPRLLEHALVNLLLNACDACDAGGTVIVDVAVGGAGARQLEISVVDDGHGISPDDIDQVTRPFFTTKERDKGTGLGLAISSEIVRAHRGELRLSPRRPRGTSATIVLPTVEGART